MKHLDEALDMPELTGDFSIGENAVLDYPWKNKIFRKTHVQGGSLSGSLFQECSFVDTTFENVILDHVDFVRCSFDGFRIINCSLNGIELQECTGTPPTITGSHKANTEV